MEEELLAVEEDVAFLAAEVESVVGCEVEVERDVDFAVEVGIVVGVDAEVELNREKADVELDSLLEEEGPEVDTEFPLKDEVLAVEEGFAEDEDEEPEDDRAEEEVVLAGGDIDEDDNFEPGDGGMLKEDDDVVEDVVLDEVFDAVDDDAEDDCPLVDDVALDRLDPGDDDAEKAGLISAAASQMKAVLPCIFACIVRRRYVQ